MAGVRPIDGFRKNARTLCHSRHGVDIDIRGKRQRLTDEITKTLIIRRAAYKDNTFNIICRQSSLRHCIFRCLDGLFHLIRDQAIQHLTRNRDIHINLFPVKIHGMGFGFIQGNHRIIPRGQLNLRFFRCPVAHANQCFKLWINQQIIRQIILITKPWNNQLIYQMTIPVTTAAHLHTAM